MQITFRIEYRTEWGEMVGVLHCDEERPLMLSTTDGIIWEGTHEVACPADGIFVYKYAIYRNDVCVRLERGRVPHTFEVASTPITAESGKYIVHDAWRDLPRHNYLFSTAFSADGGNLRDIAKVRVGAQHSVGLRVLCPCLSKRGMVLGVVGSTPALGEWQGERAIRMHEIGLGVWYVALDTALHYVNGEYKFVAIDPSTGKIVEWEPGENRRLYIPSTSDPLSTGTSSGVKVGCHWQMQEVELYLPSMFCRLAGTAVPLFALRSEGSQGVGDMGDLKLMVDWAVSTHQEVIQILPINDTTITHTWLDSYPYKAISIYAFHPMYVDLRQLPELKAASPESRQMQQRAKQQSKTLNMLDAVDYEGVCELKHAYLRALWDELEDELCQSATYRQFCEENGYWLRPYAVFSYLRDMYGTADFELWPEYSKYDEGEIDKLYHKKASNKTIRYYEYVQFVLHTQLLDACNYAKQKGVILKGDIPIGITRESVEAWTQPHYFNMNGQAGAPPDAFSPLGQNWGFPTYNWEVMARDNYAWWKNRFGKMGEYFSAYRIDHILGFFRIWEIPMHSVHGLLGHFEPALPMSIGEIESFGLQFDADFMTKPYIDSDLLDRTFGPLRQMVCEEFVYHCHDDIYAMRPEFDTQAKVRMWFVTVGRQVPYADTLREGLYTLISNVLFVPDTKAEGMYHPRIAGHRDYIFSRLNHDQQEAFVHIHNHYYYERHNEFWQHSAMKKLPQLLDAAPMLACGEDLGMVPACVPHVMAELQILSLEIQRMPKVSGTEFGDLKAYPPLSVCTIGTHDMTTLRGWWAEDRTTTSHYYNNILHHEGEAPEVITPELCQDIVRQHLESPSVLCVLPLQDWLSIDGTLRRKDIDAERINVPANPRNYWHYRMHLTLEALMASEPFNDRIRRLIDETRG